MKGSGLKVSPSIRIAGLDGIGFAAEACGSPVPIYAAPAIRPLLPRASPQPCL